MRDLGIVYILTLGCRGVTRATNSQDGEKSSRPHPPRRIRDARPCERRKKERESKEKARALGHRHLINTVLPDRPAVTTPYLFQRGRSVSHVDVEVDRKAARARSVSPTSAFSAMGHHTTQSTDESRETGPEPFRCSALSDGGAGRPKRAKARGGYRFRFKVT